MTLHLDLDPTTAAALARLAAERGKTAEEVAREAVAELVRGNEPAPAEAAGSRSLLGALAAFGPMPSFEDVQQARREAWRVRDLPE